MCKIRRTVTIILLIVICLLALTFGFFDGYTGSGNLVATVIFSRAMPMRLILLLAGAAVFIGPFLFGVAVATTIGKGIADPHYITVPVLIAALLAAILWKALTGRWGIPASSSHSLIGGLVGAILASSGPSVLEISGLFKIGLALAISPVLGLAGGYLVMRLTLFSTRGATPGVNTTFKRVQSVTAVSLALSHGANNAQKTMGIIALGLVALDLQSEFGVPFWVIVASAASIALGTLMGGRQIIKKLGDKFYRIRPVHGFASQATSAAVIAGAALLGGPVSTTQTVSSTIAGVGSAERVSKVRWGVFYEMGAAWLFTVPATMLMAAIIFYALQALIIQLNITW
ncbi:MAG TPA: inorganic phosphate transporter [Anaerolineae bacterium]|nr:inorganic phosphate transporter [Anaerolineae bacterium]HIP70742.1 inorganic phosphate transporter [Anaerolineae bacterium]